MSGDFGVMGRSRPHHQGGSSLRCGYTVYWREKSGGFAAREYVLYALNVHVGFVFLLLLSLFVSISGTLILHPDFCLVGSGSLGLSSMSSSKAFMEDRWF